MLPENEASNQHQGHTSLPRQLIVSPQVENVKQSRPGKDQVRELKRQWLA